MSFKVDNAPVTILVVEDDALLCTIASDILTDAGFRVMEAHDAQAATTLLEARVDVRVVFTDWNMPGEIDGLGLSRLVHRRWPEVGVIVTSGKMSPAPGELPAGVRFISKPYQGSALIEAVEAMMPGTGDEVAQGSPVLPEGIVAHRPLMAEIGGMGITAAQPEPDK